MKKLLLGLFLVSSFAASAQTTQTPDACPDCILDCHHYGIIYENTQYDFRERLLVVSDRNTPQNPEVIYNVSWEYVSTSDGIPFSTLTGKDNKVILELYEDGNGPDETSETDDTGTYQYSAVKYSVIGREKVSVLGGCEQRKRNENDPITKVINNLPRI